MRDADVCIHELAPGTCSLCKNGPTPRAEERDEEVARCASCEAPVIWVVTEKGKRMPIDAKPDPVNGRFRILKGDSVDFVKDSELEANVKPLFASHFATCPDSASWRRSR
jgi:hypothetical protein